MKEIVDAQLPRRLAHILRDLGWEVVHTLDLPLGNRTPDIEIARMADAEDRFVLSKDADFIRSNLLSGTPRRLILVATGNVSNGALVRLFTRYADDVERLARSGERLTISPLGVAPGLPLP